MTDLISHVAPAQVALEWEDRRLGAYVHHGNYTGEPSSLIEAEWKDLLEGKNIYVCGLYTQPAK